MIPEHLLGKTAKEICDQMRYNVLKNQQDYYNKLEELVILAIQYALNNCDHQVRVDELINETKDGPGDRGIVFLNQVLPEE